MAVKNIEINNDKNFITSNHHRKERDQIVKWENNLEPNKTNIKQLTSPEESKFFCFDISSKD